MHIPRFFTTTFAYEHGWLINNRLGIPHVRYEYDNYDYTNNYNNNCFRQSKVRYFQYHISGNWARKGAPWLKDLNRIYGR